MVFQCCASRDQDDRVYWNCCSPQWMQDDQTPIHRCSSPNCSWREVKLNANTIEKLSFYKGKLTMHKVPSNCTRKYPRVQVEFMDSKLDFIIGFTKDDIVFGKANDEIELPMMKSS